MENIFPAAPADDEDGGDDNDVVVGFLPLFLQ